MVGRHSLSAQHLGGWSRDKGFKANLGYKMKHCFKNNKTQGYSSCCYCYYYLPDTCDPRLSFSSKGFHDGFAPAVPGVVIRGDQRAETATGLTRSEICTLLRLRQLLPQAKKSSGLIVNKTLMRASKTTLRLHKKWAAHTFFFKVNFVLA